MKTGNRLENRDPRARQDQAGDHPVHDEGGGGGGGAFEELVEGAFPGRVQEGGVEGEVVGVEGGGGEWGEVREEGLEFGFVFWGGGGGGGGFGGG